MIFNLISNLFYDAKARDRAFPLFKKAWESFPDDHQNMMAYFNNDVIWQNPESYDYIREALIPKTAGFSPAMQWNALGQVLSYSADGRISSTLSRLLDLAAGQGKLDDLAAQVGAARKAVPEWTAGDAIEAAIACRLGRIDQTRTCLRRFVDETKDQSVSTNVLWVIGAELESHGETRDLAINLYQTALERPTDDPYTRFSLENGPAGRLVALYARENRLEDARRVLLDSFAKGDFSSSNVIYADGYIEQIKMQGLGSAAAKLREMGFPADAIALYGESLAVARTIPSEASNFIGNRQSLVNQYQSGLTQALEEIQPADLTAAVSRMLQSAEVADSGNGDSKNASSNRASSRALHEKGTKKKPDQFFDLMILVHPREIDKATVRSLLAEAIAAPAPAPQSGHSEAEKHGRDQLAAALELAATKYPDDISVAIARALLALSRGGQSIKPALAQLNALVDKTPLEPLAPGARANARQRAVAAREVPLWMVARACWKHAGTIEPAGFADKLAARALEAARRQTENTTLLAMIREQGELAIERGDKAGAMAAWGRMLELVVDPPELKSKKGAPGPTSPPEAPRRRAQPVAGNAPARATSMAPRARPSFLRLAAFKVPSAAPPAQGAGATAKKGTTPKRPLVPPGIQGAGARARPGAAGTGPRSNLPILTLDRFEQAMQIARLAAAHDMPELSIRAVREASRAGPPVVPTNTTTALRRVVRSGAVVAEGPVDQASPRVISHLMELERLWEAHHVSADLVYGALRDAVLPPARPTEIFLYAQPVSGVALRRPQSAGALCWTAWAIKAGKVPDLKSAIAARQKQPLAELQAMVLSGQIALAGPDQAEAIKALKTLAARVKTDTSRTTADLACQVALPALERPEPELARAALDSLDSSVKGFESSGQPEPLATLLLVLARRQFQLGDSAGAGKRLEAHLEAMEKNTVRYSGDYPLYLRKQQLERVAAEYARAGAWAQALAALARFVDAPAYSSGDPPVDDVLVRVMAQLASSPAHERYKTLHDWTMPTKDRRVARVLTSLSTRDSAPEVFSRSKPAAKDPTGPAAPAGNNTELISTATALIEAAREAGTLAPLADEAATAASQPAALKVENAEVLHLLIELARGNGAKVTPQIEARLAGLIKENDAQIAAASAQRTAAAAPARFNRAEQIGFPWPDFLLADAALRDRDPAVAGLGFRLVEALEERVKKLYNIPALARLRRELAQARARRAGASAVLTGAGLADWHPVSSRSAMVPHGGDSPAYWVAHDGHVAHLAGSRLDYLLLDYPLTGTYEFSCEAYAGPWAESVLTHGGLAFEPFWVEGTAKIAPVGLSEQINIPWRLTRLGNFNRLSIQASPKKVRYLVNGHLFYEDDDPSPTAPWLGLLTYPERHSVWRGLRLSGQPQIPSEVKLSAGDRLEGWVSAFYQETQPRRRTDDATDRFGNAVYVARGASGMVARRSGGTIKTTGKKPKPTINLDDYDWAARDGVVYGRRVAPGSAPQNVRSMARTEAGTEADQSVLSYFRPLAPGDIITYEFLYEPGQVITHPALGRIAFLLEPDGVKVHWMTSGGNDLSGLAADNAAVEPANRRGPAGLPLKSGQWNTVKLAMATDRASLQLNGQTIYERAIEPGLGCEFGLFHYKDQTVAQVRNIVLRGRWPDRLTTERTASLIAPAPGAPHSDTDRSARHALIGESIFALEAGSIVEQARPLPPVLAYDRLAAWVLPSPDHSVLRLEGDFTPTFPAPDFADKTAARPLESGKARVQMGGELRAPAIALVDAARAAGKLGELAARVEAIPIEPGDQRARWPPVRAWRLLGIISLAGGDDAAAARSLAAMKPLLEKLPAQEAEFARWPEMCLVTRALSRPALRDPCLALVDVMIAQIDSKKPTEEETRTRPETWMRQVKHLRARLELLAAAAQGGNDAARPFGSDPEGVPWGRVTLSRSQTRGEGYPVAHWTDLSNQLTHYRGHDRDLLYLATPLQGEFQLDCELSTRPGRLIRVGYGGVVLGPKLDLKAARSFAVRPPVSRRCSQSAAGTAWRLVFVSTDCQGRTPHRQRQRPQGARHAGAACRRPLGDDPQPGHGSGHRPQADDYRQSVDSPEA